MPPFATFFVSFVFGRRDRGVRWSSSAHGRWSLLSGRDQPPPSYAFILISHDHSIPLTQETTSWPYSFDCFCSCKVYIVLWVQWTPFLSAVSTGFVQPTHVLGRTSGWCPPLLWCESLSQITTVGILTGLPPACYRTMWEFPGGTCGSTLPGQRDAHSY